MGRHSKRAGQRLTANEIDTDKRVNDHRRAEERKDHLNRLVIWAYYGAFVAIPLLYLGFLYTKRNNPDDLSTAIWSGLTAVIGFIFGKSMQGDDDE